MIRDQGMMKVLLLGILLGVCSCTKVWIHNNNWANPKNWDFSPQPCDAIIMPDIGYDYSVFVSGEVQVQSMQFPSTGEVMFGDKGQVSMSNSRECIGGGVANTYRPQQYSWGDPHNWEEVDEKGSLFEKADSDKIPCWTDTVQLNSASTFSILIDQPIEVGAVHIGDAELSTQGIKEYAAGIGHSQLQFINLSTLSVTGRTVCTNPEGCLCGNKLDCSLVQCQVPKCVKPIRVKGMCCDFCGAVIFFRPPAGFYLIKFKETLSKYLRETSHIDDQFKLSISLQEHESRINIQITVSDSITDGSFEGAGYESSRLAKTIYDYIVKYDIVRSGDCRIQQSHLPSTTDSLKPKDPNSHNSGAQSWVMYFILCLSIILLMLIVVILYKCYKRYKHGQIRLSDEVPRAMNSESRYKPCVRTDPDIPTYEEVLMEDMQRNRARNYNEIPTIDISDPTLSTV